MPDTPHSKYPHLYVVVRIDPSLVSEECFSLVSAWRTQAEALVEKDRLINLRSGEFNYQVVVTRLKGKDDPMDTT